MAGKIFINYRRDDDAGFTQALSAPRERLRGGRPGEGIKAGALFHSVLEAELAASDVFLAVIGPRPRMLALDRFQANRQSGI
jgi:hypothetical protein